MFKRPAFHTLFKRVQEPRRLIQVIAGRRQTGKTTIARQVAVGGKRDEAARRCRDLIFPGFHKAAELIRLPLVGIHIG